MKYTKMNKTENSEGFTIVELLLATVVFSGVLLLILYGVISFTNAYYRGNTTSATQTALRSITDDVTQAIQFGGGCGSTQSCLPGANNVCIGDKEFAFQTGVKLTAAPTTSNYGLYKFTPGTCPDTGFPGNITTVQGSEMLSPGMRITNFGIAPVPNPSGTKYFAVSIYIAYGDADLLCNRSITGMAQGSCEQGAPAYAPSMPVTGTDVACRPGIGSQFCSVAGIQTVVQPRIVN